MSDFFFGPISQNLNERPLETAIFFILLAVWSHFLFHWVRRFVRGEDEE